jgi:hypothetical protein
VNLDVDFYLEMLNMNVGEIISLVDIERLYQHVLRLEGVRHPVQDPKGLDKAANYIKEQMGSHGIDVREQTFTLEGFDFPFRNIEGVINEGKSPEILITSHYDTVRNTPGADDNASACAVMLEAARVLKSSKVDKTIRLVSFTLEETNAYMQKQLLDYGKDVGVLDDLFRVKTHHSHSIIKKFNDTLLKARSEVKIGSEAWKMIQQSVGTDATPEEMNYFKKFKEMYSLEDSLTFIGKNFIIGSKKWVEKAKSERKRILGVINLETIGFTTKKLHSQSSLKGIDLDILPTHKFDRKSMIGDFILIISDDNSSFVGQAFFEQCKNPSIDLPAVFLGVPLNIEQIASGMFDLLRSDHASFWKEGYPAIMVTDTANFRTPYYHTPADRINTLDFDFIKKVCQATIMTAIELNKPDIK